MLASGSFKFYSRFSIGFESPTSKWARRVSHHPALSARMLRPSQTQSNILPRLKCSADVVKVVGHYTFGKSRVPLPSTNLLFPKSKSSAANAAGLLGIGILVAGLVSLFLPSQEDRMVTTAKHQVLNQLAYPSGAVFAQVRVAEERVRSWTSHVVQGCVKERNPTSEYPMWQGFSVEGDEVSFRSLYCPFLP